MKNDLRSHSRKCARMNTENMCIYYKHRFRKVILQILSEQDLDARASGLNRVQASLRPTYSAQAMDSARRIWSRASIGGYFDAQSSGPRKLWRASNTISANRRSSKRFAVGSCFAIVAGRPRFLKRLHREKKVLREAALQGIFAFTRTKAFGILLASQSNPNGRE